MRKLVIALVATSAIAGQAAAEIRSGFYLGANASANALLGKGNWSFNDSRTNGPAAPNNAPNGPISAKGHADQGRFGAGVGVYAGYGMLSGCMYYAGELAYNWNSAKTKQSFSYAPDLDIYTPTAATTTSAKLSIKNENIFNFAALIGRKVNPSTVLYVRLGGNVSEVEMKANVFGQKLNKSKTEVSFVPGVGMETSFHKNWVGRLEYTYDLGNKVSKSFKVDRAEVLSNASGSTLIETNAGTETYKASTKNVGLHSVKLGIAYKF